MRDQWKFPSPVSRLYRLVGVENAVRTPDGIGTLRKAHSYPGGCQVQLLKEKERTRQKPYDAVMRQYDEGEVHPA